MKQKNYGPFYNVLKTHARVEDFMLEFHQIGKREFTELQIGFEYDKLRALYDFWIDKGFLSQKQIRFATTLVQNIWKGEEKSDFRPKIRIGGGRYEI